MKKHWVKLLIFFSFGFSQKTKGQNLVPNPSFENFIECPDTAALPMYINFDSTWFGFNSPDYFNVCDPSDYRGVPANDFGYQYPYSGNTYMGLIGYTSAGFDREYIEVKLLDTLLTNQTYYIQYRVSLGDTSLYAIENIATLFTDTLYNPFPAPTYAWVTGVPQFENPAGNMLNNKTNWTLLSGSFIASGGEQYLTIGNFRDDATTIKQFFGGTNPYQLGAYYYIDDVYVGTTPLGIEDPSKNEARLKLYPNPNNGVMTLECYLAEQEGGELIIYTLTGAPVKKVSINPVTSSISINAETLQSGMYLYELKINGRPGKKDKLTIIK